MLNTATREGFLLDIDGTLAAGSSRHLDVLTAVLSERVGRAIAIRMSGERPILQGRDVSGFVDAQLVRLVLDLVGEAPDEGVVAAILATYGVRYQAFLRRGGSAGAPVPGAREFLDRVVRAGAQVALVTGNSAAVAQAKLEALRLAEPFSFGPGLGFGDRCTDRAGVAAAALDGLVALGVSASTCTLVGDTSADMRAAGIIGVRAIGVLTGAGTAPELLEAGADAVFPSIAAVA